MNDDRSDSGKRVVLLARPGVACDRLRGALAEAGADVVLEADPLTLDPAALDAAQPQVVMVALDPQTEDALDRFDALRNPAIDVIFEEAEIAANREGWEAARWVRHLTAKLHRHGDVLPPGTESAGVGADSCIDAVAEFREMASTGPSDAAAAHASWAMPDAAAYAFDPVMAETSFDDFEAVSDVAAQPSQDAAGPAPSFDFNLDFSFDGNFEPVASAPQAPEDPIGDSALGNASEMPAATAAFAPLFDGDFGAASDEYVHEADAGNTSADPDAGDDGAGVLELASDDDVARMRAESTDTRFKHDLASLESRIAGMELVDDRVVKGPAQANGAVLVLAGIGGPDAVRQLLGALPVDFPRPVLVQQRLDGGRYDKLVAQMQRATSLKVALAEPGLPAIAGGVYILPAHVSIKVTEAGVHFTESADEVLGLMPSADSAVLLLSGSDPAQLDAVMNHSWAGALVIAQSPDGCYDASAPSALIARGGDCGQPAELARRLTDRWPH